MRPESAVTSVSYNRALLGYLVLFVQPTNAAHLFHSLKVRGEKLRDGMKNNCSLSYPILLSYIKCQRQLLVPT